MHVGFSDQKPIVYVKGMNQLVFRDETEFVSFEAGGARLCKIQGNFI
jgi:hypothetical protein